MDNEKRLRMIEVLRSGQYRQVRLKLAKRFGPTDLYCCIGAAYVAMAMPLGAEPILTLHGSTQLSTMHCAKALSMNHEEKRVLVEVNDDHGLTFPQIANFMESDEFLRLGTPPSE